MKQQLIKDIQQLIRTTSKAIKPSMARHAVSQTTVGVATVCVVALTGMYLHMSNQAATFGFELQEVKAQTTVLAEVLESLDIQVAQAQTMFAMKSNPAVQRMEQAGEKTFVITKNGEIELITTQLPQHYIPQIATQY